MASSLNTHANSTTNYLQWHKYHNQSDNVESDNGTSLTLELTLTKRALTHNVQYIGNPKQINRLRTKNKREKNHELKGQKSNFAPTKSTLGSS